ncbi:MAPK regulated corepressor interacting protein 2-like [Penaeus japonicus]|uniref:MAPK regulated corepressor interacting protein 2-like n=1 Tax=Penaeus japonicus TaxID=27405 RepID=UPI001C70BDF0|nr:MAPK regulated corepressor interacting protein 2-like [Penaeus japonicus]
MYTVSRGPSRIIHRTRRDLSQKLESLDQIRELRRKSSVTEDPEHTTMRAGHKCGIAGKRMMSSPRPVFQSVGGSKGGRGSTNGRAPNHDAISPQHEELIRFFNESWGRVYKELEMSRQGSGIAYYQEKNVHPALQDFKPFDLEEFWGKRMYQNLTQS